LQIIEGNQFLAGLIPNIKSFKDKTRKAPQIINKYILYPYVKPRTTLIKVKHGMMTCLPVVSNVVLYSKCKCKNVLKTQGSNLGIVDQTCNPRYLQDRDWEDRGSRTLWAKLARNCGTPTSSSLSVCFLVIRK
jgi:hypothetical protein